jgi:Pyruvate/2-oxoacid:ferredoxin oxidoreductase gamma subunit
MTKDCVTKNVLFYGVGGQGVLSAAEICAQAAMNEGHHVKQSEVKGMSQRGGSVESYVRFGTCVFSPLPEQGQVDILVCLYKSEYPRLKDELKAGGIDLMPYLDKASRAVGDHKMFLNTYMLGVVSSFLEIKESSWMKAIDSTFSRDQERNREYFLLGRKEGGRNDL